MLSFVVLSLLILSGLRRHNDFIVAGVSALNLSHWTLTKNTAVFALPLLTFLASTRGNNNIEKIKLAIFSGIIFVILTSGYNFLAERAYPEDFALIQD